MFLKSSFYNLSFFVILLSSCTGIPHYALFSNKPVSIKANSDKNNQNLKVELDYVGNSSDYLIFNLEIENQGSELFVFNEDFGVPNGIYVDQGIFLYEGFPKSYEQAINIEELVSRLDYKLIKVRSKHTGRQIGLGVALAVALVATELSEDDKDKGNNKKKYQKEIKQNTIMTGASLLNKIDESTVNDKIYQLEAERETVLNKAFTHHFVEPKELVSGYIYLPLVEGRRDIVVYVPVGNVTYEFSFAQRRN